MVAQAPRPWVLVYLRVLLCLFCLGLCSSCLQVTCTLDFDAEGQQRTRLEIEGPLRYRAELQALQRDLARQGYQVQDSIAMPASREAGAADSARYLLRAERLVAPGALELPYPQGFAEAADTLIQRQRRDYRVLDQYSYRAAYRMGALSQLLQLSTEPVRLRYRIRTQGLWSQSDAPRRDSEGYHVWDYDLTSGTEVAMHWSVYRPYWRNVLLLSAAALLLLWAYVWGRRKARSAGTP